MDKLELLLQRIARKLHNGCHVTKRKVSESPCWRRKMMGNTFASTRMWSGRITNAVFAGQGLQRAMDWLFLIFVYSRGIYQEFVS